MSIFFIQVFAAATNPFLLIISGILGAVVWRALSGRRLALVSIFVASVVLGGVLGPMYASVSTPTPNHLIDPLEPYVPDYYPSSDIQGTKYEQFSEWFISSPNPETTFEIERWINAYEKDCRILLGTTNQIDRIVNGNIRMYGSPWFGPCRTQSMFAKSVALAILVFAISMILHMIRPTIRST